MRVATFVKGAGEYRCSNIVPWIVLMEYRVQFWLLTSLAVSKQAFHINLYILPYLLHFFTFSLQIKIKLCRIYTVRVITVIDVQPEIDMKNLYRQCNCFVNLGLFCFGFMLFALWMYFFLFLLYSSFLAFTIPSLLNLQYLSTTFSISSFTSSNWNIPFENEDTVLLSPSNMNSLHFEFPI